MYANINLSDIYVNPYIDAYITTKPDNKFIKTYLPKEISDKLTISGEISASAYLKGTAGNFEIEPEITLYPDAEATISGVRLGDIADKRNFIADVLYTPDRINLKKLDYYKYITTQNNNIYPLLFAYGNGVAERNKETGEFEVKNAYVKTEKNISAKLLNIFLDKPIFKQGTVNCDLKYIQNKIEGTFDAKNIDFPIFDSVIKNIKADTDEENINVRMFGFVNDSAVGLKAVLDNDFNNPLHIDSIGIHADSIDMNKLLTTIENAREDFNTKRNAEKTPDLSLFQIEQGKLLIDSLTVKNYTAKNIQSDFSIDKNGSFKLDNMNIQLGDGSATGNLSYDLKESNIVAVLDFKNVDSNSFAENLFDAKNQIYGNTNANLFIETKGNSEDELIKNLSGLAYFDITDGKMPKLGSLEYLLRASNIIKGGVTGFTINNVLEILNLVKTGYFTNINGVFKLDKGRAHDIEVFSQGENMSLYLHGDYDIPTSQANMEILGKLSNRISTIFGPIGNTSLNTFFKHIPGISLFDFNRKELIENVEKIPSFTGGNYDSRTFQAIIKGDINSSGYVQSFKWVK